MDGRRSLTCMSATRAETLPPTTAVLYSEGGRGMPEGPPPGKTLIVGSCGRLSSCRHRPQRASWVVR